MYHMLVLTWKSKLGIWSQVPHNFVATSLSPLSILAYIQLDWTVSGLVLLVVTLFGGWSHLVLIVGWFSLLLLGWIWPPSALLCDFLLCFLRCPLFHFYCSHFSLLSLSRFYHFLQLIDCLVRCPILPILCTKFLVFVSPFFPSFPLLFQPSFALFLLLLSSSFFPFLQVWRKRFSTKR